MGHRGSDQLRGAVSVLHLKCRVSIQNSQALERKIINSIPLQQTGEHCLRTASAKVTITSQQQTPAVPTKGSLPWLQDGMGAEAALPTASLVSAELLPHTHSGCNHNAALKSWKLTQKETKVTKAWSVSFAKEDEGEKFLPSKHAKQAQSSCSPQDMLIHSSAWTEGRNLYIYREESLLLQPKEDAGLYRLQ